MNHIEAKALVDRLGLTPQESLVLRAVSWAETNYGLGWKDPAHDAKNNMGAITTNARDDSGGCLPQDFSHGDSRREGEGGEGGEVIQYTTCFKGSATPFEGFQLLRDALFIKRPLVREAARKGLFQVAAAMREKPVYYTGIKPTKPEQIQDYFTALDRAMKLITAQTKEPNPWLPKAPATPAYSSPLPVLRCGDTGPGVELFFWLACKITTSTYLVSHKNAVQAFQSAHVLKVDGIVGPATWATLLRSLHV